jgi:Carboxypeptidase regulatory-like domain
MRLTILLALLPTLALVQSPAQSPAPHPEDLGTVTGHITCADTQRPARLAQVSLVAVKSSDDDEHKAYTQPNIHTDLTGGYTLANIPPGRYYLRVDLAGYTTPISQFAVDALQGPTPDIPEKMQHDLQVVTVTPNSTTHADVTLYRGGSIAGTVIYDDGSPAISANVQLFRREASGKFNLVQGRVLTDSHGEFVFESLPAGEYVIKVVVAAMERHLGTVRFSDGQYKDLYLELASSFVPIYSGNVFRDKDASIIKVDAGQEENGIDITIPIGRLHEVSGTLLAQNGHVISDGKVELLFADTQEYFTSVYVHDNGIFHLPYVPEGSYILKVTAARDITLDEIPESASPGSVTHINRRTTHTYGDLQQPLTVQTSDQSLNLTLPDAPAQPQPGNSASTP